MGNNYKFKDTYVVDKTFGSLPQYNPWKKDVADAMFQHYAQTGELSALDIQLGGACNGNCGYCDSPDCRKIKPTFDIKDIERLVKEGNISWISVCGLGEPTVSISMDYLKAILKICEENNVKLFMFTNLIEIDDELIEYYKKGILHLTFKLDSLDDEKEISLFGITKEQEDKRRNNLKKLIEISKEYNISGQLAGSIVPTNVNKGEILDIFDYCVKNDIYPFMGDYECAGSGEKSAENLQMKQKEMEEILVKINSTYGVKYKIPVCPSAINSIHISPAGKVMIETRTGFSCPWFLLEDPQMTEICDIKDFSFDEICKKIEDARIKGEPAIRELYESIKERTLAGCGGDPVTLVRQFLDKANFRPFNKVYTRSRCLYN